MNRRKLDSGLTLLETLVALGIMAMLAMILSSGIGFGLLSLGKGQRLSDEIEFALDRRQLRDWLERALSDTPPYGADLVGTRSTMRFAADVATSDPRFDPRFLVLVVFEPGSNRFSARTAGTDQPLDTPIELLTAPPATELTFEYWGRRSPEFPPNWGDDWSVPATLPDLVRITFDGSGLPPMVVQPGKAFLQSEMSLSSLVPPALPSRP